MLTSSPPSDKILIAAINQDCTESFKILFERYIEPVTNYAFYICGNKEMANDIAQEVFLKVWEKRAELDRDKSIKYFLFVLVKNKIISDFRKLNSYRKYCDHFNVVTTNAEHSLEKQLEVKELSQLINYAIDLLPEKRKMAFKLSRDESLSYKEIGEKMNISPRTVEVHIALAMKNIKEYLHVQYS
ncbi:RNA polymerase sigma factor [Flagellimonas meridianipacifica]|uniref:RNA polymerase sigma-70 factor (ECF subfamily) n=1 Tax=Flagellimonas meridianipacifica TaxID=1080225 RepID=A0A2T0M8N9_9FLAO|nr:RNA polymerase sigma-70 factor [Allomuricauda pacifica]PRX53838.1 RNA polymerase sigma-70 factor (ECF subfamily) [Allomuricauda pacifica]